MKVIVFDLDDTLYEEKSFVYSGYQAVSRFLKVAHPELPESTEELFQWMAASFENDGRDQLFDRLLRAKKIYSKKLLKECLSVYRLHKPNIILPRQTANCLAQLRDYPLYVVTDGNKIVQKNKLEALGLFRLMKYCYITHRYGICHAKPSPYCFLDIAEKEQARAEEIVYIGDNPKKDFIGIRPLGFRTIRVLTGCYRDLKLDKTHEAELSIATLTDITEALRKLDVPESEGEAQ